MKLVLPEVHPALVVVDTMHADFDANTLLKEVPLLATTSARDYPKEISVSTNEVTQTFMELVVGLEGVPSTLLILG